MTRALHHYAGLDRITVHQLSVTKDLQYDLQRIQYQFDRDRPDVVIVSHASNVIGLVAPAEEIFCSPRNMEQKLCWICPKQLVW